jgi:deazaflavin-dependent oxidoreductase (nitroreductase family)
LDGGFAISTSIGNAFIAAILRSPFHSLLGNSFGVITVTGRKTGRRISTPINLAETAEGYTVMSYRKRTWWRNLIGGRGGELRVGGKIIPVTARIVDRPDEVRDGLKAYFKRYPEYAKFFEIHFDDHGEIPEELLARVANDRVIIQLITG